VQEQRAAAAVAAANECAASGGQMAQLRTTFERAGGAVALVEARKIQLSESESSATTKEGQARDLRRQIEDLRGQLSRYAEALEEDLAAGRQKVAARTREGLVLEKAFADATNVLITHLKSKPDLRELLQELMSSMSGGQPNQKPASGRAVS
jgi:eukaryotic-like serine/threonine-protein kinase